MSTAGLVLAMMLAFSGVAVADTTGDNADLTRASAGGEDDAGSWNVGGVIDALEGTSTVELNDFRPFEVQCEDGSILTGYTSFFGQGAGSVTIDKKLAHATGDGTVSGTEETYDPCVEAWTLVEKTRHVQFDLDATSGESTSTSKSRDTAPDGTKRTVTTSIVQREASGSVVIDDGEPIAPDFGEISHVTVVTKTKP
jgi:hypothetical protein